MILLPLFYGTKHSLVNNSHGAICLNTGKASGKDFIPAPCSEQFDDMQCKTLNNLLLLICLMYCLNVLLKVCLESGAGAEFWCLAGCVL